MADFIETAIRKNKGIVEVYPKFKMYPKSKDLMIRGGDFYAIWDAEQGVWSTDEDDALRIIDAVVTDRVNIEKEKIDGINIKSVIPLYSWDSTSGIVDAWHKYCQKQKRDSYVPLDDKLVFSNSPISKNDYASKRLPYPLEKGNIDAYDRLMSTLYAPEERHKLEWAVGSIVNGDSKQLQKFFVLYGSSGTGKSTFLNIVQDLFQGYYSVFDARALGASSNSFALEAFKSNPLVAIQHDGDLSKIEDNTRLNSLVSHEYMTVNEKFKSSYTNKFKSLLFMGTNKPVRITDAKSGIIRRLIDVVPTGNKVSVSEYRQLVKQIPFELGAIAYHCKEVYEADIHYYDSYIPTSMMGATNDFYNFILDTYQVFKSQNETTLKQAWELYKQYCDDAKVSYPLSMRVFKEELKNYFKEYEDGQTRNDNGERTRNLYKGFKTSIIRSIETNDIINLKNKGSSNILIELIEQESIFDKECKDCFAQYANNDEMPTKKWDNVTTKLSNLDTSKVHYVRIPENHIVIDFDIKDEFGKKSFERNLEAASMFPPTYAELSKGGAGIHLHYIYDGDVTKLARLYADEIEIKVFSGKSSLRRRLTKCNNLPIKTINSGLPMKGGRKVINKNVIQSESKLRNIIERSMEKEFHPGTKPSVDFIYKVLEDAYESGMKYDVSDMMNAIYAFAANSTNQSNYCIKLVNKMHFKSETPSEFVNNSDQPIIFYDVEVFPNLFLINWKLKGEGHNVVRMINPDPKAVEELLKFRLIGYNCRRYDNHILYARLIGYSNEQLFNLSQKIINNERNAFFGEAYNLSYTDVYDFASAANKMSLKKLEVIMGITHKELGLPWDKPVPEDMWIKVAEYCDNDVIATEAAFNYLAGDWSARQILADLAGMDVNSTTNSLSMKIIFGDDREPQGEFSYRNMAEETYSDKSVINFIKEYAPNMKEQPIFKGYKFEFGVSTYKGIEVGEGGYVYAEPGIYKNVAILDVASMHPTSIISECLFGPKYTKRFAELVRARIAIKHEDWIKLESILDGKLMQYIDLIKSGAITSKQLSNALKTVINSVYGLTSANFPNSFRDNRNKDNIVAKRGALFMIDLKEEVQKRGFTVAHIKTDSIKIPNATEEIIKFVMDFGQKYGYTFEHEGTYERMCLVNDAVFIARYGDRTWTATGTQFQVPYVFKTLFSKEPILFEDMCETKSVKTALYLDINEQLPDVSDFEKELAKLEKSYKNGDISEAEYTSKSEELYYEIDKGHDYHFIGKVGNFCPVKPNCGGGELLREQNGKYNSATGSKGYRWLESNDVRANPDIIDKLYYEELVEEAMAKINEYGDFEMFVNGD